MSDVVAKSVISLELDDSHMLADLPKAQAILLEFIDRMQKSANITLRADKTKSGKDLIRVDVDPKTTTAGMEVIRKIVKEYTARLNREAKVTVGVDEKSVGYLQYSFQRLKSSIVDGIGQGIGQAFVFTITRGIERAVIGAAKAPFKLLASSLLAYRTQESAELKLGKAIEATSGQVRKSQAEIIKTAKELEKLTGTTDTTIIAMQGILAAAKGLSGEGFDRATKAALDLSEVLGGDPVNKAEKLAKALQEPEKALEMLRDEGVSFTKTQQDVVKYFVKINDVASAQGIILDAIESKYYGASTATGTHADEMERLSNEYNSVLETMGAVIAGTDGAFIPALETGISVLDAYTPVIAGTTNAMLELAAAMLDYSIEGDRANLTTEEAIQKASEFSSALKAVGTPSSIWSYLKGIVLRGAQGAAEAFDGLPGSPADKAAKALKEMADEANAVIDEAATEEENKAIANREAKKKRLEAEAAQRRADADKRRVETEKRLAEAAILAKKDQDQEAAAKDKKKRLKKEEAAEDKRLKEEERARLKAQQDFEKSMGRDSLVGLHQRIQDAMYLRREEAKKKKQDATAEKEKTKPSFAPEDPDKWSIPWVKQQEEIAKKKQEKEEQALKDRDKREARFKADEAAEIALKGKEEQKPVTQEDVDNAKAKLKEIADYNSKALANGGIVAGSMNKEGQTLSYFDQNNEVRSLEAKLREQTTTKKGDNKVVDDSAKKAQDAEAKAKNDEPVEHFGAVNKEEMARQDKAEADRKAAISAAAIAKELEEKQKRIQQGQDELLNRVDFSWTPADKDEVKAIEEESKEKLKIGEESRRNKAAAEAEFERNQRESIKKAEEDAIRADVEAQKRAREKFGVDGQFPPLSSATPPSSRKRSFAPEGTTPSFAPEGGDIKVTVKPEQKEVVSSITTQTKVLAKAITESRKLT